MVKLAFETLKFIDEEENIKVIFLGEFFFHIKRSDLEKLGHVAVENEELYIEGPEAKVNKKFDRLLNQGFNNLQSLRSKKPAVYIHKNSGIPIIGSLAFGIVDKGSSMLEVKPCTGCNINCIYCSVDEGLSSKRKIDFVIEKDYLVEEAKKLLDFKEEMMDIYINTHGEPLIYKDIVGLVEGLASSKWVNVLTIITNGTLLTKDLINELIRAGLNRLNISLPALTRLKAKRIAGTPRYDAQHVMDMIEYASKKIKVIIAPVYMPGVNEDEMINAMEFAKKVNCELMIQNFLYNQHGRNPIKGIGMDEFFEKLKEWEKEYDIKLIQKLPKLKETKKYKKPFIKKDIVEAEIIAPGRMRGETICAAKERLITVKGVKNHCGKVKIRITRSKHNIFYGEVVKQRVQR